MVALAPVKAAAAGPGTDVCGFVAGTWNALGSPYRICSSGVEVAAATTLTLDGAVGPVQVVAQGMGSLGVTGTLQTANTSQAFRVDFDGPSATPGSWGGIGARGQPDIYQPPSPSVINLAYVTIHHADEAVSTGRIKSVHLDHLLVDSVRQDAIVMQAPDGQLTNTVISGAGSRGVAVDCRGDTGNAVVSGNTVSGAGTAGIQVVGCAGAVVQNNVVTGSGKNGGYPALGLWDTTYSLGPGNDVAGNTGGDNGINAAVLAGTVKGGFSWVSPQASPTPVPLGYVSGAMLVKGPGTVTFPVGSVVKGDSFVGIGGTNFDAGGGGAIFTSANDNQVGMAMCPSTIAANCSAHGGSGLGAQFGGINASDGDLDMVNADVRYIRDGLAASRKLTVSGTQVHDGYAGIRSTSPDWTSLSSSVVNLNADVVQRMSTDAVAVRAYSVNIAGVTITDAGWAGIDASGLGGPVSLVGNSVTRAGGSPIVLSADDPVIQGNVVRDSGHVLMPGKRAIEVFGAHVSVGPGEHVSGNTGNSNSVDAIGFQGSLNGDLVWVTPTNSSADHPLGYVLGGSITVGVGRTVQFPPQSIVKVDGFSTQSPAAIDVKGGTLDASAGGSVFTSTNDATVGVDTCPHGGWQDRCGQVLDWGGITVADDPVSGTPGRANLGSAEIRQGPVSFWASSVASPGGSAGFVMDGGKVTGTMVNLGPQAGGTALLNRTQVIGSPFNALTVAGTVHIRASSVRGAAAAGIRVNGGTVDISGTRVDGNGRVSGGYGVELSAGSLTMTCDEVGGNLGGIIARGQGPTNPVPSLAVSQSTLSGQAGPSFYDLEDQVAVSAHAVWWGQAGGPLPGQVSQPSQADTSAPLSAAPSCAPATAPPPPPPLTSVVAAVDAQSGHLLVRAEGESAFQDLGGNLIGAPAVVNLAAPDKPAHFVYVATQADHDLYIRDASTGWRHLVSGGRTNCVDNPAAVVNSGSLFVACTGARGALWYAPATGAAPLPFTDIRDWRNLGGSSLVGPAAATMGGTDAVFFVTRPDSTVWWRTPGSSWQQMANWQCRSHPTAATSATGVTLLACRGVDDQLRYASYRAGTWSAITSLAGVLGDGPAVAALGTGARFYAQGSDHHIYQRTVAPGVENRWRRVGGQVNYGVGATAY